MTRELFRLDGVHPHLGLTVKLETQHLGRTLLLIIACLLMHRPPDFARKITRRNTRSLLGLTSSLSGLSLIVVQPKMLLQLKELMISSLVGLSILCCL
ncbi:hypothetical protein GIB67_039431 [Kingdonia uniflora]|uniref:Uncharacterized protein n=1 Tax=Kingdonia uniflora TaxID=39325 RepID=A0A7J7LIJ0_9MAGN|nr:hypothetical protein GIB67_039431 [Kingdonia uniflora]